MKIMAKFNVHSDPVNSIAFHPSEPVLVSVGADRSTHFFDLEQLREMQTSFPLDSSPIEIVRFAPNVNCALTASSDYLRLIGWSPAASYENLQLGFQNVYDISLLDSVITIAASSGDKALIYRVNLASSRPFSNHVRSDVTPSFSNQNFNIGPQKSGNRPTTPRMLDIAAMRRIPQNSDQNNDSDRRSKEKIKNSKPNSNFNANNNYQSNPNFKQNVDYDPSQNAFKSSARSEKDKKRPSSKVIASSKSREEKKLRLQPDYNKDSSDDNDFGNNNSNNNKMPAKFGNEGFIYDSFRENRTSFMAMMNERYSRIMRVGDMLDSGGLKKTLDGIAESGDLGPEALSLVRLNPDSIKLEHTPSIMRIASLLLDKEPELAVTTIEEMMEAFGKLVHATLLTKSNGNEEVEKRKQNCQLFVEAFKEMQGKLRTLSNGKKEQSQIAGKLLNDWRIFLR